MNLPIRLIALVVSLSGVLAAVATAYPETSEDLGIDFWHVSALEERCAQEERLTREMEQESEKAKRRIEIRQSIVIDVLDGRRTLADAAAVFLDLNQAHAGVGEFARSRFAGRTQGETAALQVIEQVKRSGDPRAEAVSASLKAEFDRGGFAG